MDNKGVEEFLLQCLTRNSQAWIEIYGHTRRPTGVPSIMCAGVPDGTRHPGDSGIPTGILPAISHLSKFNATHLNTHTILIILGK